MATTQATLQLHSVKDVPKKIKDKYLLNNHLDIVMFELLAGNKRENQFPTRNVPGLDFLFDADSGEEIKIHYKPKFKDRGTNRVVEFEDIIFTPDNKGIVTCNLSTREGREKYEFLSMSNYNESNPYRDKSKRVIFRLKDNIVKQKELLETREHRIQMQSEVIKADTAKLRQLADWLGHDSRSDVTRLRANLLDEADAKPGEMKLALEMIKEAGDEYSVVVRGLRHSVIDVNRAMSQWIWKDTKKFFFKYDTSLSGLENNKRLAMWLKEGKESAETYDRLKKALKAFDAEYKA